MKWVETAKENVIFRIILIRYDEKTVSTYINLKVINTHIKRI